MLKWLDNYHKELHQKTDMGEVEWRNVFIEQIIKKGLEYPSKLVRNEKDKTDIIVTTPELISHIVFETKKADTDLDKLATLEQAKSHLQGGESFLVLASPQRLKVYTPRGTYLQDIYIAEISPSGNATFWQLSYDYMLQKKHLIPFREGNFDYCYIPVDTPEGFKKFVTALQLCGDLLMRYLKKAWIEHEKRYGEYKDKWAKLQAQIEELKSFPLRPEEGGDKLHILERETKKLLRGYKSSIEVMEVSFPYFQRIQPYSKDVQSKDLVEIYLADITYAALDRILFVRIAEDKGLLDRKISNGGIGTWRRFVTFIKDEYQDLLHLAYRDARKIYEHFFEEGIFDWYIKGDSVLGAELENILFLLNSFDLSKVDRDTLGDLYQAYLPREKRKKLGEFYTPREVVDYILKYIVWQGEGSLLDPACGSGSFLVRAASIMLDDLKERGLSEELRLGAIKRVVGLDINPFATHIAELNILFLILETYLKAKEASKKDNKEFHLDRLPIYTIDSLTGAIPDPDIGGTTWTLFTSRLSDVEEAIEARDKFSGYDYLVMNPPYVRNERLPEEPRKEYRLLFKDVTAMNADIFTYFMRRSVDWLKDGGRLGVIVSLGLADARANDKLRQFLAGYTIERIVPLEWCEVFAANVNPMLLFLKKTAPSKEHRIELVHGITSLKDLKQDKGRITRIEQDRWLSLAPDSSWRVEVRKADLQVLEKLKAVKSSLNGEYGMALRGTAKGQELISEDISGMKNPYPILDGREIKAWSIEWQGRYIDYQPNLISDPKTLDFFKSPKVIARLISRTTQAVVDDTTNITYLFRNTAMIAKSLIKELNDFPYIIASLINSLPIRYYAFLVLRAGVVQKAYSHIYSNVIAGLPTPKNIYLDIGFRNRLDTLSQGAHGVAKEMVNGDKDVLKQVDSLIGVDTQPFGYSPGCDLSGYMAEIELETAHVSDSGELTSSNLSKIKGEPALLQYILARASLEAKDTLTRKHLENFPVPKDIGTCVAALEQMSIWAQRKPTLSQKLAGIQNEVDDLVLSAFTVLTNKDRLFIKERAKQFPMKQVLVPDEPGVPTRRIPVKYWKTGERYK